MCAISGPMPTSFIIKIGLRREGEIWVLPSHFHPSDCSNSPWVEDDVNVT